MGIEIIGLKRSMTMNGEHSAQTGRNALIAITGF